MDNGYSGKNNIKEKLLERQSEARVVRRVVLTIFIVVCLAVTALVGGGYLYIKSALQPADPDNDKKVSVTIPIGSTVTGIAGILEDNGIIKDAKVFRYYVKFRNEAGFQAGDYAFSPSMNFKEIISTLKTGKVKKEIALKITIPEGKQLTQIAKIISEKTGYDEKEVFSKLNDKNYVKKLITKYPNVLTEEILGKNILYPLEGYLFPATYSFYKEKPELDEVIDEMLKKTDEVLTGLRPLMEEQEYSIHKLMTMGSLVEEEATEETDRKKIASVFYNRIKEDMKLQTDPTVLYALGKHKDRVYYKDLEVKHPYNTYVNKGLPPGPIANPGELSLKAALSPEKTEFLYFLAAPDGKVYYSKTLEEHNRLKDKYITNDD